MEQLVTHFPSLAAWLIVIIGAALLGLVGFGGREMIKRLDSQDTALDQIRQLLASEVHKLREMQHCIDIRLARVEERMHNGGDVKYGRRANDHLDNHLGDR